jgi:homoserine kinase type II
LDTSKMLHLEGLNSDRTLELLDQSHELCKTAKDLVETLEGAFLHKQLKEVVENNYDLGNVTAVYEIFGGYVNRSFGIVTEKDGKEHVYFVRKYKKGIQPKEIQLEHNMITCAKKNGLDIAAGLFPANNGKTYVKVTEGTGENSLDWYFAVYEYLEGEDKYTWVDNELTDKEYASSAEVIAIFHNSVKDFDPKGLERVEPQILDLLRELPKTFKEWAALDVKNRFHEYYVKSLPRILEVNDSIVIPEEDRAKLPLNPIHCDYHPGNLKFENEKAVGIFDFDWSKIDIRVFEVGLALVYFCASWVGELDGVLHLDRCKVFLDAYQRKLKELGGLPPLNETELRYMPEMLNAGNIYLIFWCLRSYYDDLSLNVYEYLAYLSHQVKCMNWVEEHREEIMEMVREL